MFFSQLFTQTFTCLSLAIPCQATKRIRHLSSERSTGGKAECISGSVQVPIVADNLNVLCDGPRNAMELTQLFQELQSVGNTAFERMADGRHEVKGVYDIFVKLCLPARSKTKDLATVQLLTHGGGLSHNYWDMAAGYSYVDAAAEAGYATLSYDRLGVGRSAHPDPIQIVQAEAHSEIVHGLAQILRGDDGLEGYHFASVVGVGHSFGSWFTQTAASRYPNDFDALVLTGTSTYFDNAPVVHSSMQNQIANTDPSGRFANLTNGYIIQIDHPMTTQFNLYFYPHFDKDVLLSQHESRQTLTIGELLTLPELMRESSWSGPLAIVNGERDFVYCAGDCFYQGDQTAKVATTFFPRVGQKFSTFVLPDTGHNLPAHHRAQEAYDHIFGFLRTNNLLGAQADGHTEL